MKNQIQKRKRLLIKTSEITTNIPIATKRNVQLAGNPLSERQYFLNQELPNIANFLSQFQYNSGAKPTIEVGAKWDYIIFYNFPLPDEFVHKYKNVNDNEDILMPIPDYPLHPPCGIYVKNESDNLPSLKNEVNHFFDSENPPYKEHVEEILGWHWLCAHYKGFRWNFNIHDFRQGDNLQKFLEVIYCLLEGGFKV